MVAWLGGHASWLLPLRASLLPARPWLQARSHLNIALQTPSPASLEIETMPYPTERPDASVFESVSEEYRSISTPDSHTFTPRNSVQTLALLVERNKFRAAESLLKDMKSNHIPIPRNSLYLRAALQVITDRRRKRASSTRLDMFEAWLSLVPDHHEEWRSFHLIRRRIFLSTDHVNIPLVYRFGLVLVSKGYYNGGAAMQIVSALARCARACDVKSYLLQAEELARAYHSKIGTDPPPNLLTTSYRIAIETVATAGKNEVALGLLSMAHSRGLYISNITRSIVVRHAPDEQVAIEQIQTLYPWWAPQDTKSIHPTASERKTVPSVRSANIAVLAARLRSLRIALRSPSASLPATLRSFISSCEAVGRTRTLTLLRSHAYRCGPRSAFAWAVAEMLHHRIQQEYMHLLVAFSQNFHLVGVPRKSLLSLVRGKQGRAARRDRDKRWGASTCLIPEKLWPTAFHTGLAWEAIVWLSPHAEKARLYEILLAFVRQSKQQEPAWDRLGVRQGRRTRKARLRFPPRTFDAIHFSPFVFSWVRVSPTKGADVLRDMMHLGIEPSVLQWSIVAGGYAHHGEASAALRILNRLTDDELGKRGDAGHGGDNGAAAKRRTPSDLLVGTYTNVMQGLILFRDVQHAREVEALLMGRLGYQVGTRETTDTGITRLRELEKRLGRSPS